MKNNLFIVEFDIIISIYLILNIFSVYLTMNAYYAVDGSGMLEKEEEFVECCMRHLENASKLLDQVCHFFF